MPGSAGADLDAPHAVVVTGGPRATVPGRWGRPRSCRAGTAACSTLQDGRLVLVLPRTEPREAARIVSAELRRATGLPVTAGTAGPARGPAEIAAARNEAARCLQTLLVLGRRGEVAGVDDLGFVGLLLGDDRDVPAYVGSVLGPVLDYDAQRGTALVETLRTYFAHGGNLGRTGSALHVHANTVTQRLERITHLLGEGWNTPDRQLEVQLALRLHALLD
ncbi:PucR family transcriptional regulator [Georgenia sp. SUBG003]|uniref:PucR family transcriptional regulator n=1 Tax=Georgenia sp. SUBG003 TaxID=1497974 RepID=UPI003AB59914